MRAAIYARFSTENQAKESITDQVRECTEKAQREGFDVVAQYTDEAISGGTADRPGYQAMLEAGKRREFDIVVAEDMKRLWREQAEQWRAIKEWIDHDIAFVTVSGIDSRQANFEMIASVMGASAELDRKETAFRTRRGLKGKALAGSPTGGRTFGYTSKNELVDAEAQVVMEIFDRYAAGESQHAIAKDLNVRGAPSPKGNLWYVSAIHALLHNERYLGRLIWGASRWKRSARNSKKRTRIEVPRTEWTITEKPELRLVSDETWQRVRARDTPATYGSYNARPKYALSGLLLCAECGRAMTLTGGANSRGYGRGQRYVCPSYREHGNVSRGCSNDLGIARLAAEELLIEPFRDRLLGDQNFLNAVSELQKNQTGKDPLVLCASRGTRRESEKGDRFIGDSATTIPGAAGRSTEGDGDHGEALLAAKINAIESAAALGALTQREAAARCASLRADHERSQRPHAATDEASILANVGRLRAALLSAAVDALRDALRRTLGTVRCQPVLDDGPPYLMARFEGGDAQLLEWLCIGDAANQPGLTALVAGAGFEPATFGL
jgi:site-specific DNA recombinase